MEIYAKSRPEVPEEGYSSLASDPNRGSPFLHGAYCSRSKEEGLKRARVQGTSPTAPTPLSIAPLALTLSPDSHP